MADVVEVIPEGESAIQTLERWRDPVRRKEMLAARAAKHPGRPTKLNAFVVVVVCEAIYRSGKLGIAIQVSGVREQTFYKWRRQGKAALEKIRIEWETSGATTEPSAADVQGRHQIHAILEEEIVRTFAQRDHDLVAQVNDHASKDWRAAAWLVDRDERQQSKSQKHAETRERVLDSRIELGMECLTDDETREFIRLHEKIEQHAREASARAAESARLHDVHDAEVSGELASRTAGGDPGSRPIW